MLSKNPFRTHVAQSSPTVHGSRPESPPLPPLPPSPQPSEMTSPGNHRPTSTAALTSSDFSLPGRASEADFRIDDDLPPAYTPSADASMGEETLEVGPRRPYQQQSQPHPHPRPGPSSFQYAPSHSGGRARPHFHVSPGQQPMQSWHTGSGSGSGSGLGPQYLAPWQTQNQYQRNGRGGGLIGALLRDVFDVVSGADDERMMAQRANATAYAAPSGPPPHFQHTPPPRPRSTPPRSPPAVPDDGTPTRTAVPGHPLLRDGNLLVYPKDHLCVKCKNTGYKNYDPSSPCRKCWEKHSKPYTGALTYTPWSRSGNDPRMQRALPRFSPPHLAPINSVSSSYSHPRSHHSQPTFPPPPQHPRHDRSLSHSHAGGGQSSSSSSSSRQTGSSYYVVNPLISWDSTPPVPDAIPVSPGDPRLGGWLCTRCGGEGVRTMLLFDLTLCEACGGTGRVWR